MNVLDVMEKRYSVRGYLDREVEKEKLDKVLKAAQIAPTGVNAQAFKIYVIDTKKHEEQLRKVAGWDWFFEAPLIIAVVANYDDAWTRKWDGKNIAEIDATIVMDHIILEATELGLGTCYIAAFHEDAMNEFLDLDDNQRTVLLTPLGYPNAEPRPTTRKDIDELVEYI
ncbi:MAG: nitroreductase [Methanosphaera sp. rholeuAM130]|nr:nitroreductase family protein [Methanosphaera sp.]RAP54134.1 MAG: nitroreductase [Methanosphaera sp. rholeuAM130]